MLESFAEYYEDFDEDDTELPEDASDVKKTLWYAEKGHVELLEQILEKNPELVNCRDSDCYTPLHRASYSNKPDVVELLLKKGANMGAKTTDGWTPLHSACKWGNYQCALILLMHGCPFNEISKSGASALHLAAECRVDKNCMKLLLSWPGMDTKIKTTQGDTAYDMALRSTKMHELFRITRPAFNEI